MSTLYTAYDLANSAVLEHGGYIVQTARHEYWHCPDESDASDLLEGTDNATRADIIAALRDFEANHYDLQPDDPTPIFDADALRTYREAFAIPTAHLEMVGPSSDYCNRAWLLSGNIRSPHHTLFETDDRTFEVLHTTIQDDDDETRDIRRIAGPFDTIGEALAWFESNRA